MRLALVNANFRIGAPPITFRVDVRMRNGT
jgi:hypothetical protein